MNYLLDIVFWLLENWEVVWKAFAVYWIIIGLFRFFTRSTAGSRSVKSPGVSMCCLGALMLFWIRGVTSPEGKAAGVLTLPEEAQVLHAEEGDWAGDGSVTFKLPTNHSVKYWINQIWEKNGTKQGLVPGEGVNFLLGEKFVHYSGAEDRINLDYDDATQTYSYTAELAK